MGHGMDNKAKVAVLLNLVFVLILLIWPLITAPKFQVILDKKTVPLGGTLRIEAHLPGTPASTKVTVVNVQLNRTMYTKDLGPTKDISLDLKIDEDKYRIGLYAVRVSALIGNSIVEEEALFHVFGGDPIELSLQVDNPNITAFLNETSEKQYAEVSTKIKAKVTMGGRPVKGAKLLVVSLDRNTTVTDVVYTDDNGEASIEWKANATENKTYTVVVQAIKPGHPISSATAEISVRVERRS